MSDYKYSIEAKNVNKTFYKKTQKVKALIDFSIKIKKGNNSWFIRAKWCWKINFYKYSRRFS